LTHNNRRQAIANKDVQICGRSAPQRVARWPISGTALVANSR